MCVCVCVCVCESVYVCVCVCVSVRAIQKGVPIAPSIFFCVNPKSATCNNMSGSHTIYEFASGTCAFSQTHAHSLSPSLSPTQTLSLSSPSIFVCVHPKAATWRRRWRSNPSGKCSHERPTRGTGRGTIHSKFGADAGCLAINYRSPPPNAITIVPHANVTEHRTRCKGDRAEHLLLVNPKSATCHHYNIIPASIHHTYDSSQGH